jgi:hypothetical protein
MSNDDLENLFNEFFPDGLPEGSLPPPTEDELRIEAMTATELHMSAFYEASEERKEGWESMLPSWLDELKYYLKVLEDFEEYEQCAKVFKTMREIREVSSNIALGKSLEDLTVDIVYEGDDPEPEDDGIDF